LVHFTDRANGLAHICYRNSSDKATGDTVAEKSGEDQVTKYVILAALSFSIDPWG
jgi:hypothetical protein